jgi:predicted PurR-regulated permease PerM
MKIVLSLLAYLIGAGALINEVRGIIMAGPVLYALWLSGGTWMALWLAFCSLMGIALSVIVPMFVAKKIKARLT